MARKKETNGIQDTVERLFGNDEYRTNLSKLVSENRELFKPYLLNDAKVPYVFERSTECDNLIKNVLLLWEASNSYDFAIKVVKGKLDQREISKRLDQEREKMEVKFKAYGYWLHRFNSLKENLSDSFDMTKSSLEDCLETDSIQGVIQSSSPYAIRAVRLLEKVEEEGRVTQLTLDQLTEKAWALYRLGIEQQAIEIAGQITKEDPTRSDAWLLLAMDTLANQNRAAREYSRYVFEAEYADVLSAHERWAEEMQDEAANKYFTAKTREKDILFNALLHWPKSESQTIWGEQYKNSKARERVRTLCIDWLFSLVQPDSSFGNLRGAYQINGLEPEYEQRYSSYPYFKDDLNSKPCHGLNKVEMAVAKLICDEYDQKLNPKYDFISPDNQLLELKLLHVRFVLQLNSYESARKWYIEQARKLQGEQVEQILKNRSLLNAFTTHLSLFNLQDFLFTIEQINTNLENDRQASRYFVELNFCRKAYDHAFVRAQYKHCIKISQQAQSLSKQISGSAPTDVFCTDSETNKLTTKYWKYLEILAASKACTEHNYVHQLHSFLLESLLSVSEPETYFSNESEYMPSHYDYEYDDEWYSPSYGSSIIESGLWLSAIERLATESKLSEQKRKMCISLSNKLQDFK
ncbi:hypothetical protein EIB96_07090 [Vibrio parahaemolyticus]|uniref:bacterial transcriptional activator domain-containing protein n=1 Tax=Vibrio parahaemolyticus TaxID=670 RepID=UPI00038E6BC7|nr:bacterial transcriptional activator domain-containing protein [Vibrio parahaemolyticus]EGR0922398.1 hypothetical protein [Vibrio parahaemolyticus]EGR0985183.1 hypothetical protein [Vibrio parahaemolyticus]EGR1372612.1 hypothetical protein [Vibrio parahaemolyticus]EGR1952023.1 hypothetical protein [Vibrio parahaemolyticus]EIN9986060.1 bacterial transcriptional activator domain-containing protein [Vibrio parahaemolyticus]